ncbi:transcriptional regulator [Paenibacillus swuensis]|uniref:Transcriptional regulator n=1 Tax=Paenibacillus swuensis TaxID=1178515 RepID=A0A172TEA7_9BACL|nr:WYL domain-containing protein [Paenibacillus swuensis]ANE45244.1 transcriptional regulator [Paenibacillus swuensis]
MARESFDKEIQLLRVMSQTGGAYTRQQFAKRMGISVHTYDKTIRRLKDIVRIVRKRAPGTANEELADSLRNDYYNSPDPILLMLFRAKSVKESESHRLSLIVQTLNGQAMTTMELLDACCAGVDEAFPMPDEKTIRSDLKYLEDVGVVYREPGGRPHRYQLDLRLLADLSEEERTDLYDFVDVMANTQIPSVQGFLLRDSLKRTVGSEPPFAYKYHYPSRLLDEAHLYRLLAAIQARREIQFVYYSPKSRTSYGSRNTNPLFESQSKGRAERVLPMKVIYDHQYGRWYVVGMNARQGLMIFRMEGLTELEEGEAVDEDVYGQKLAVVEQKLRLSWMVDTTAPVVIRARFFHPGPSEKNFVKERVLMQGQWGVITEEDEASFVYEITVNGMTEIKPWLRSFGSSCEVLEPARLRQEFIAEWKELQGYYESVREDI